MVVVRVVVLVVMGVLLACGPAAAASRAPDLGPNVKVLDPSMPVAQIQATVDAVAAPADLRPVRDAALHAAVQARHVRHRRATR